MTILNRESDGLYSILLTLSSGIAREKTISRDDLLRIYSPLSETSSSRVNGTLNRWITLGLFAEEGDKIRFTVEIKRGESPLSFSDRLPTICRKLALSPDHGNPLWPEDGRISEEGVGLTADLCRGLAWCLSQDIYTLPSSYRELEILIKEQIKPGRFVFLNDTRWPGLRDWARFLGFATGDDASFFFDPTAAVSSELAEVTRQGDTIPALEFVERLSKRLPVLDTGSYRLEVEEALRPERWSSPPTGQLSTALSFALRRLQKQGVIGLVTLADAGSRVTLTRQDGRAWESFTHVSLLREVL
jgi:hypothetical protein